MKSIRLILSFTILITLILTSPVYAVDPIFTVTSIADTTDGTCDAQCTLREAITAANGVASSSILFDTGIFATPQVINLASALPNITASVIISGPAAGVTIRRNSVPKYRIFSIPNAGLTVKIYGLTITNGDTNSDGGGIYSKSYLELKNTTVDGNLSGDHGGGVSLLAGGLIEGSTISNNSASSGGGIYFEPAPTDTVLLINSTVSANTSGLGTGILLANFTHLDNVTLNVNSCTIAFNPGISSAMMVYTLGASRQATLNLTSTILSDNEGPNLGKTTGGGSTVQILSGGYNLATDAALGALTNTGDQVNTYPNLKPLADNGGPTKTHALPYLSVASDHGNNPLRSTDQRGLPRIRDLPTTDAPPGGDGSDVGAFEYNEVLMVENDQNSGIGSLRAAIEAANADTDGNYIEFDPVFFNNPRVIRLQSPLPDLSGTLFITGPGAGLAAVRRHSGGDYRIFTIPNGGEVWISDLTISNGKASSGGGIESRSSLRLKRVVVSGNQATFAGGGVSSINSYADIIDSTLADNRAGQGGGIAFQNDVQGNPKLIMVNSTVSGNRAGIGSGLILTHNGQNHGGYVYLESSTIAENQGAAIHADISTGSNAFLQVTLHNTIVANPGYANLSSYQAPGNTVSLLSGGYNLFSDAPGNFSTTATDQFNMDPLLAPLSPNGGPTPVHALRGGSPALDQGQHGYSSFPNLDQRSLPRDFDIPGIPSAVGGDGSDIGAVEMRALTVTNANDSGAGSLRQAMLDANSNGVGQDDILFDNTFFLTPRIINLAGVLASITSSVNLVGPGADHVNLRRNTGGDYGIITNLTTGLYIGINDMTLSNGKRNFAGGGIYSSSFLDLRRSVVSGNVATSGGGILLLGSGVIESSTISGNSAPVAGGISFGPIQPGFAQLVNSTVSDNSAASYSGISVAASTAAVTLDLEVMNSTIANNTGGSPALNVSASGTGVIVNVTLANSLLANNSGNSLGRFEGNGAQANIISLGNNLATDSGQGFLTGPGDLLTTDPLLDPLANYGGTTPTRRMATVSPAVDAANCALSGVTRDQRGKHRPFDRPGSANVADACDIGALEWSDLNGNGSEDSDEIFHDGFE